jgi:hypothetical protein
MYRHRVVDTRLNPIALQGVLYGVALCHTHGVNVVHVTAGWEGGGDLHPGETKQLVIPQGVGTASFGPGFEVT